LMGTEGHVVAFEPEARNLSFLRRHVSLNRINNIEIVDAAVSDQSGTALFCQGPSRSMGKLSDDVVAVRTLTLDDFICKSRGPVPDVMKIDVEGAEMRVLRGAERALSELKPLIFLATHGAALQQECRAFLSSLGYTLAPIGPAPLEMNDELIALPKCSSTFLAEGSG